ncbi:hypothetical protein M408DRAFT_331350 [Serendipita vermifera MAFF 305830]|uniref:Uncharacterized protein n=1 Tax=Serendipita vermifera MAFF 305830 TaxID=933852 RepID=A0A0C2WFR7_SERVB|nr:hypothetical protein M408DRAFT_331350 [Serendipita vermifera MAFF 305830]
MSQTEPTIPMEDLSVEPNLEDYVKSQEFDRECAVQFKKARERASAPDNKDSDYKDSIWSNSNDGTSSSVSSVGPSLHEVSKVEAYRYYAGLGHNGRGPKLIYRTSDDKFVEPEGPRAYRRLMKLCTVPEDHELGQEGLWDRIRDQVVELLDKRRIKLTSVDLVQFTWLDKKDDQEIQEEEDDDDDDDAQKDFSYDDIPPIKPIEDGKRHTTNPTVWVAVLPDTLTGAVAQESAIEILGLLKELGIASGVDVVYRESVTKFLYGPGLFAPVSDLDPLKDVVDDLSTPLSLPIAGRKTKMQGTLGCYFRVGNDLYAITARHNVFPLKGDNEEYNYNASVPKKEVVVMSTPAFTNYLASVQANIGTLIETVDSLEKRAKTLTRRVEADGDDAQKSAGELEETQGELTKTRAKIDALKAFFVNVKRRWSKVKDRIIGYVVWAPPLGVGVPPHRYTRDLCVIKLDKKKFRNFRGNVLSLGPEISPAKFKVLMYDRIDVPSEFDYPEEGLLPVQGMLSVADINNPNGMNLEVDPIPRVIKRGFTTNTTVGTLSRFMSHGRKYFATGNLDSVEVAILPHDNNDFIAFSRGGDSGALIVDARRRFVALLTGGTSKGTSSSDITFATPMEWVWDLIKDKFPGANLYFDDLEAFLADVV